MPSPKPPRQVGRTHKYKARRVWACRYCEVPAPEKGSCRRCGRELVKFDSKAEYNRWLELALRVRAGELSDLELQPCFPIVVNGQEVGRYYGDFRYRDSEGRQRIEDVKGKDTAMSKFKRRCVAAQYGVTVELVHK